MKNKKNIFIFIGFDKSGSTWLYNALLSNNYVSLPQCKETFYFDRFYEKGEKWFISQFNNKRKVWLDICHDYIFDDNALNRIKNDFPQTQVIIFLRNPIEKCFSLYKFAKRNHTVTGSFRSCLDNYPGIIERSYYADRISKIISLFGKKAHFFFFDNLQDNPIFFYKNICKTLCIPAITNIDLTNKINQSASERLLGLGFFAKFFASILRTYGFTRILGYLKKNQLLFHILFKSNTSKIGKVDYNYLLNIFNNDIAKTSKILNIDLSHWKIYK